MLDGYQILTITHRSTDINALGQAMISDGDRHLLQSMKAEFGWEELMYLNTCNRVMYLFYQSSAAPVHDWSAALSAFLGADTTIQFEWLKGAEAVRHLFAVAASIDSLVVGEREIIRQIRGAFDRCRAEGLTGDHIRLLMRMTIETAKEVYAQTGIGEKPLSVVALAFEAMQATKVQPDASILMIGAGETNGLFAKFLAKYGYTNLTITNRTAEKAHALAATKGGKVLPWEALPTYTEPTDVLIVCTAATTPVVTASWFEQLAKSHAKPVVVIDLSVPANVEASVAQHAEVHYISVESLRQKAEQNRQHRTAESVKAMAIIQQRLLAFREVWHERQIERALAHIPDEVRAVKDKALYSVFDKEFAKMDTQTRETVLKMMDYMEKKCVAIPIKAAKSIALHAQKQHQRQG